MKEFLQGMTNSLPLWGNILWAGVAACLSYVIFGVIKGVMYKRKLNNLKKDYQRNHKQRKEDFKRNIRAQPAADLDDETNCVVEFIEDAQKWAEDKDKEIEKKPLHGIPFSTKECHPIKGFPVNYGNIRLASKNLVPEESWVANKVLIDQGAVPFARSNVPFMAFSYNSWNPLFGNFSNPHDKSRHCGGSTGGEAALVAGRATHLSLGGDLAGSIRIPSTWCGVVGLKCGSKRISTKGFLDIGLERILPTFPIGCGPISPDVDTAAFTMKHLLVDNLFDSDPKISPIPWRNEIYMDKGPLKIGYFEYNGVFKAVPSMERAVRLTKQKLEALGHTLVPFEFPAEGGPGTSHWSEFMFQVFAADGAKTLCEILEGYEDLLLPPPLPRMCNMLIAKIVNLVNPVVGKDLAIGCGSNCVYDYLELLERLKNWRERCIAAVKDAGLDAVLSPAMSAPAMLLKHNFQGHYYGSYAYLYNTLDWPAGVLPVTKVTQDDITAMKDFPKQPPISEILREGMVEAKGLPVNVQIAVLPYKEELCLNIMKQIEEAL